ncbi:uncharacterized protein LOC130808138 [Amaranthus tricolor]|uniref:uncharacterized protein LOC130808138 n=1 Tax=Amaranthus tricolor TaxID=29722 RepID=UPI00258DB762|nr:uncharacterized protein LOC130808138 [Amaranthus tricolor]
MSRLAPLSEEPFNEEETRKLSKKTHAWKNWVKNLFFHKKSDLKILLSVLACPLFPVSLQPNQSILQVSSSSQYIIEHFRAATGCKKLEKMAVKNIFVTGKVTMTMLEEPSISGSSAVLVAAGETHKGCFVMWEMLPNKWSIELVVGGHKVLAGSDGNVAWRYTPWLGSHPAKGGVRPLRRALQGLDPMAISEAFSVAQYMGEKEVMGTDCFVLKLSAEQIDLADRSDNTAETIKHVTFGYFSQKSGLLVYLEDSYLTRIQSPGGSPRYWETTMGSKIEDYRTVEGVMIAHSGQTHAIITRFGDNLKSGPTILRMEEAWMIDDFAFNVQGLSLDCFIPPQEVKNNVLEEKLKQRPIFPLDI